MIINRSTSINLIKTFLLAGILAFLLSACAKDKNNDRDKSEPDGNSEPVQQDCKILNLSTRLDDDHIDSISYIYNLDRVVQIKCYENALHTLDIFLQYPDKDQIFYSVYRKTLSNQLSVQGTATLKDGLVRQMRVWSVYGGGSIIYNMEYTADGYLLRIREGDPQYVLSNFQDFTYTNGNLTNVYNSATGRDSFYEIRYTNIPMQKELADRFVPFIVEIDVREAVLVFYRNGWLGRISKNMPQEKTDFSSAKPFLVDLFDYKMDAKGKIVNIGKRTSFSAPGVGTWNRISSVSYQCKGD